MTGANQHALIVNRTNEVTDANGSKQPVPKSVSSSYGILRVRSGGGSVFSFDNPFNLMGDTNIRSCLRAEIPSTLSLIAIKNVRSELFLSFFCFEFITVVNNEWVVS